MLFRSKGKNGKKVSEYFRDFIGCQEGVDGPGETRTLLKAISGSISFVGLMIPHIARRLVGAEHRRLLPVSALLGSVFLVWVDVAARTLIAPEDLPIGVATAAIGGLFFIGLMRKR